MLYTEISHCYLIVLVLTTLLCYRIDYRQYIYLFIQKYIYVCASVEDLGVSTLNT